MRTLQSEPIVNFIDDYAPGQTFEQFVVSKVRPYLGSSIRETNDPEKTGREGDVSEFL
ncbi:hypothetical protein [Parapedobacter sp. 2B3]|uniref:hypothetical protein n=1 Tax=Parapedobacter sp. 2B3 TaxID=3342381 RepID=UPI0035B63EB4